MGLRAMVFLAKRIFILLKEVGVQMEEPIVVKQSTKGTLLFSFGALVLAVLSLFLILVDVRTFSNGPRVFQNGTVYVIVKVVAIIGVVFFGYAFFYLIKRAKQGKAILVVDEKGVTDNSSSVSLGLSRGATSMKCGSMPCLGITASSYC